MIKKITTLMIAVICMQSAAIAQTPKTYTSSEILQQVKKLNVLGSVLYIAAHPDDENTRLLAYLANEKLVRTGYLSLTRGDGGQNLIGDEQGIDLGLIRTQELLAARRIDGAEQFFSRAYDFGFCKTPEEALKTWGHDKILSDVVWVVRKFRPDVIIARFPEDSRAGHGHHAASGILAREAFDAAADPTKFPEQLKEGVTVWQAKRMLWNTFNFGNTNTTSEDQFKLDAGMYNPLLGKSYGELAALGRSQHKSQGFGVPAQRGQAIEYFSTIKGDKPASDLLDGVDLSWKRTGAANVIQSTIDSIYKNYSPEHPENSVSQLVRLYKKIDAIKDEYWREQKQNDIKKLLEYCSGLFMEATAGSQYAVQGDSLKITATFNNRLGVALTNADVNMYDIYHGFDVLKKDVNASFGLSVYIRPDQKVSQPYWLENKMEKGGFNVTDQQLIGRAENEPLSILFGATIDGVNFKFKKPVRYKYTDPVKGEIYQPVQLIYPVNITSSPSMLIFKNEDVNVKKTIHFTIQANTAVNDAAQFKYNNNSKAVTIFDSVIHMNKGDRKFADVAIAGDAVAKNSKDFYGGKLSAKSFHQDQFYAVHKINYDHIPEIAYNFYDQVPVLKIDLKIAGSLVGYIPGAGDKVPQALEQMGYKVVMLKQTDLTVANLKQFDAIVTGVRAYNINEWLSNSYDALMQYVNDGGVLLTQYNTSNAIGPVKAKMSPYPFTISRNRVTDEEATVNFLLPDHPALNYPNKITAKDFEGWVQERSIYNAENIDASYQRILSMKDPNENDQDGSLIIANYGKGRFIYTGLVFFRELPAAVPGAYRLFANLIAAAK
ncbi:MAG: LmbE family protein [Ferruginibacter sp.]|uniref:PIG-L family deacetylase n=1 Tax=Ferruginibacter sp. TaxID=1940288 RepID=UPI002658535C|nr:PIG-L family deacetylase [Ferruginibacter sp.]MDB5279774.1 LmbE family protein [Ferruginibacter sp.]